MVSTASSTVNVFCPEHQRERKIETKKNIPCQQSNSTSLLWNVNIFHVTVGPHQEKGWKHLLVVCPFTSPWANWWLDTSGGCREEGMGLKDILVLNYSRCFGNPWLRLSIPFPCPNCRKAHFFCTPGVWAHSHHGQCEPGGAPVPKPCKKPQLGALGSVLSPKPLLLTFPLHFRSKQKHLKIRAGVAL